MKLDTSQGFPYKVRDLFGNELTGADLRRGTKKEKRRDISKGNAAPIGSGPKGETCKSCKHSYSQTWAKKYWKCDLVKPTRGCGTDIRLKWAACSRWEKQDNT